MFIREGSVKELSVRFGIKERVSIKTSIYSTYDNYVLANI